MGRIDRSVNSSRNAFQKLGQEIPILGRAMRVLSNPIFAVGAAVTGIGVAFKNAVGTARVFQQQLADTAAIVGIERTDAAFQGLTQSARELGATTEFSATEAAQAMEELARAGFDVNQILKGTPGTLALATVGNLDLAKAADIATNVLSQYGKEAGELGSVVDVLAKTTTTSNTNVTQLADAFNYLGPTAKALGISLEESAAAVGVLANSGLKGSLATRALGTSLVNLTAPTTKAAREIEKIGLSAFDSQGNFVGLAGLVEQLEGAYSGYTAEQRQASLATIFGAEAIQELNILLDKGSGGLRKYTDEIAKAGAQQGAFSQQIRETKLDTFEGSLKLLASAWEELQLAISSGSLDFLAGATRGLADGIRNVAGIITGNLDFGDVFGPVGDQLDSIIDTIRETFRDISRELEPLRRAFRDAFGDGSGIITAIFLPAITLTSNAFKALRAVLVPVVRIFSRFAAEILPPLASAFDTARESVNAIIDVFRGSLGPAIGDTNKLFDTLINAFLLPMKTQFKALASVIKVVAVAISRTFAGIAQTIRGTVALFVGIKDAIKISFDAAGRIVENFVKVIGDRFRAVGNILEGAFTLDFTQLKQGFADLANSASQSALNIGRSFSESSREYFDKKEAVRQAQQAAIEGRKAFEQYSQIQAGRAAEEAYAAALRDGITDGARVGVDNAKQSLSDLDGALDNTTSAANNLAGAGSGGLGVTDSAKAARGSVSALNDQLTGLNERLANAAPTTNTDSIRAQIAAVGRELSQLELNRLGINVDLSASIDPATLTGIDAQIKRVKDEIEANQLFIEIGSNAEDISAQLTEARQKIEALRAGAALLDDITVGVTEGDTQGVLDRIKAQVSALSNEIAEQEVYVNILSNTGGTEQDIQTVNNEITSLKDNIATLEALQVDIQSGEAVNAIQAVKDKADELRGTLDSQQIKIDVLTDTAGAGDSLAAVQSRVSSLISELQGLEGARIDITSGDSSGGRAGHYLTD
jgi:TP901 family phage tail tape measure protein